MEAHGEQRRVDSDYKAQNNDTPTTRRSTAVGTAGRSTVDIALATAAAFITDSTERELEPSI